MNSYTLRGRTTVPLVILPHTQGGFRGYVALDLHSADAPQVVWYYSNAASTATGVLQVDTVQSIVRERNGDFLISDGGTGPQLSPTQAQKRRSGRLLLPGRQGYQQLLLLARSADRDFDVILTFHTSRWGRGVESEIDEYALEKSGVKIIAVSQPFTADDGV
jgi:hypothetical protein